MLGVTDSLNGVMVLIVVFMLIAGCFIDGSVLIIMLTPIFLPLIRDLNGDPVHFGLVFIIAVDDRQLHAAGRRRDVCASARS